jgi:hypothetical protein
MKSLIDLAEQGLIPDRLIRYGMFQARDGKRGSLLQRGLAKSICTSPR